MRPLFSNISVILLLLMPLVTMRLFAEERRSGTIELLLTYPVRDGAVLSGKYLAALALYATMLGLTLLYPAIVAYFARLEWGPVLTGYLGLLLMGAAFLAVGVFASSLTENQIVAAIVTFGILLIFWIIGWGADSPAARWAGAAAPVDHRAQRHFAKGVLDTKDVLYYLNFTVLALFLTCARSRRGGGRADAASGRLGRYWLGLGVLAGRGRSLPGSLAMPAQWTLAGGRSSSAGPRAAVVPAPRGEDPRPRSAAGHALRLNTLVAIAARARGRSASSRRSPSGTARMDLTENRRHSLSPQTIQLLKGLKTEVNAVAFYRGDQPGKRVAEDLFKQYARYSNGKLHVEGVDPDREPTLARRYGVETYGTIVLETKAKSEKVQDAEGGEAHQRPGQGDRARQAGRLRRAGPRRARARQHRPPGFSEAKARHGEGQLRGQAAGRSPARARSPTTPRW